MLIAAGTILEGKYRVERLLGAGGMGSVWIAEHTLMQRSVAIKILDATAKKDATAVQRFLREAQTAARLRSDHIVDVLDVGRFEDGVPFLVMELLEGETLSSRIRRLGRLVMQEAATFVDQLLDGLGAAHAAGVIHRDIKPDNCFITTKNGRDHLKLLDFGISKVAGDPREMRMTKTGVVMGTPYYMAPEQARGAKEIDHRCDLYATGAILYECLTGRVPFDAESVNELLFKIVLEPITPPHQFAPELERDFEALILHAMGREAGDRFQTAEEFRLALGPWVSERQRASAPTSKNPMGNLGSGPRVIVTSSPPPKTGTPTSVPTARLGTPSAEMAAVAQTAPIDSDPIAMHMAEQRRASGEAPSRNTPNGLLGMSATGPIHPSQPAPRKRGVAGLAAIGLVGVAMLGGIAYVATRGTGERETSKIPGAPLATPEPKPKNVEKTAASSTSDVAADEPTEKTVLKSVKTPPEPSAPKVEKAGKVPPAASTVTLSPPQVVKTSKPPTPTSATTTAKSTTAPPAVTSPRPIDTSL